MKIEDKVYGKMEINEQVLIDLINSKEVQRLKEISQFGMPSEYYHLPVYSRYEHSIGVFLLLRMLNAELKEQIAGLLHDISHTAFSHVIDWVIGDSTKEDYQDNIFSEILKNSLIPFILSNHDFDYKDFLYLEKFYLLEQPLPSLCADRFDYAIREIKDFATPKQMNLIFDNLRNINNRMVFSSQQAAHIFAAGYIRCQNQHWAGNQARARYYILANVLKRALNKKIIHFEDIKTTDKKILDVLKNSEDKGILAGLDLLRKGFDIKETNDDKGIILKKKFRYIDPEIFMDDKIKKLSEVSDEYHNILEKEKQKISEGKKINIVKLK